MYASFLGVGAQRAATTWLHHSLRRHPDLWLPPAKELHYFDWMAAGPSLIDRLTSENRLAMLWRQRVRGELRSALRRADLARIRREMSYELLPPSDSRYLGMFHSAGRRVAGEITPAYSLLSDSEVKRVAALLPDARVIIMLRNPIGRAWSQVQLDMGGRPPSLDFAMDHVASTDSLERGNYPAILDRWLDHFPRERVFVGFVDEARTRPAELIRAVVEFLGVDPERMVAPLPGPINASGVTTIPTALAVDLARRYAAVLEEMSLRLGGPAEAWRNAAERLLEAATQSADLPLPLADDLDPGSPLTSGALAA
jgi:Sulfotransferase family